MRFILSTFAANMNLIFDRDEIKIHMKMLYEVENQLGYDQINNY